MSPPSHTISQIFLKRYIQKVSIENRKIPIRRAVIHVNIFFLFCSFGVQIARNKVISHSIDATSIIIQKLPFMNLRSMVATSFVSMPNITMKNWASPGLNTIYARKLAKNIIPAKKSAPIALSIVHGGSGSFFFFGSGDVVLSHVLAGTLFCSRDCDVHGSLSITGTSEGGAPSCDALMISARNELFSHSLGFSGFIEKYEDSMSISKLSP